MAAKGIILGMNENEFGPAKEISRAQFAAIIARMLGVTAKEQAPFEDVLAGNYYAPYIAAAYGAGIIQGKTSRRFDPNASISREEMAVMIIRAYEYMAGRLPSGGAVQYADTASISQWAKHAVDAAGNLGILQGKGHKRFDPQGNLTRAEAAQAIANLLAAIE